MAKFEVRVRLLDVAGHDGWAARRLVEERLRSAGFSRWQITGLGVQESADFTPTKPRTRPLPRPQFGATANVLLIAAAFAVGLWFWLALL
jgi:hypothetical protein